VVPPPGEVGELSPPQAAMPATMAMDKAAKKTFRT
jgi:hypothetical protein